MKAADLERARAEVEGALQRVEPVEQVLCAIHHRRSRLRAGGTCRISPALEATQNDGFFSQLPYKCYLEESASVGD